MKAGSLQIQTLEIIGYLAFSSGSITASRAAFLKCAYVRESLCTQDYFACVCVASADARVPALARRGPLWVSAGMSASAERTGAKDKNSHSNPPPLHMALGSLAWMAATGVASDHLGGYWMAMAAFCNNLARSKFIRVKFGPGCSTVVPTAFGPAALRCARPSCGSDFAGSRESH